MPNELQNLFENIDKTKFVSNAHTKQNRMFGFVTTNLRNAGSFVEYIKKLVPVYKNYKNINDLKGWQNYSIVNKQRDKQKYKRFIIANYLIFKKSCEKNYNLLIQNKKNALQNMIEREVWYFSAIVLMLTIEIFL